MQGRNTPSLEPSEMCPTIKRNCCRVKDQLTMYSAWKNGGQERLIQDRFKHAERVYIKYLGIANKIRSRAHSMLEKNRHQKVSNCNILANRIVKFEVDDIMRKVRKNLDGMKHFFEKAFKGFYCGVCNYDNHKYFDLEEKVMKVDNKKNFSKVHSKMRKKH